MIRRRAAAIAAAISLAAAIVPSPAVPHAAAFCTDGGKWPSASGHYGWASNIPTSLLGAAKNGILGWNGVSGSSWSLGYVAPGPYGPPAPGSGWFAVTATSSAFGGAPGLTLVNHNSSYAITSANTYLDSSWTWNASGTFDQSRKIADMTTVVLHEAGHWLTLIHPELCSGTFTAAEKAAVMHVTFTYKWSITSDDVAGLTAIY